VQFQAIGEVPGRRLGQGEVNRAIGGDIFVGGNGSAAAVAAPCAERTRDAAISGEAAAPE